MGLITPNARRGSGGATFDFDLNHWFQVDFAVAVVAGTPPIPPKSGTVRDDMERAPPNAPARRTDSGGYALGLPARFWSLQGSRFAIHGSRRSRPRSGGVSGPNHDRGGAIDG